MSEMKPDIQIRLLVTSWPKDSPRGAVTFFCKQHNVSRSWFYKVRAEAEIKGKWGALELRSTRPESHPARTPEALAELALAIRADLKKGGLDFGPLSVSAKLRRQGLRPPSRATLARIFMRAGVVTPEPRKKPRTAFRRFVYPAPNCCWQIDATNWTLASGRVIVIFQVIDDHSRLALASLVASGETAAAALEVVSTAIERHGVPQKFLSDNGTALNNQRRGRSTQLVTFLHAFGVETITGKPGKPTTQGKNERFHRTLHKYLNAREPSKTMEALQAHVDRFDRYYNTQREHQGLAPGMTPQQAWDATPVAPAPAKPRGSQSWKMNPHKRVEPQSTQRLCTRLGSVKFRKVGYMMGREFAAQTIHIVYSSKRIAFFDSNGTQIISHPWPAPGATYVGNGKPRGFMATQNPPRRIES
jgi:putative transposase